MYSICIISGDIVVRTYNDVVSHGEKFDDELGEFVLWVKRVSNNEEKENVLILCSGWNYCVK